MNKKSKLTFTKFLGYIIVFLISFIALIVILDTFKSPLSIFFPKIDQNLESLYELYKDILYFMKDLLK